MPDETDVGAPVLEGATSVSSTTAPLIEVPATKLSELLDAKLDERLTPLVSEFRGLQGKQDKADNRFREFMDEYRKAKTDGATDEQAEATAQATIDARAKQSKRDAVIDALAEKFLSASPVSDGADEVAKAIARYRLDERDPSVSELYKFRGAELQARAADMGYSRATKPPISPSGAPVLTEPSATPEGDLELLGQIQTAQHRGDLKALGALEVRARERGLFK
jgi:hypothetical protein